jgi:hypothetical protein
MTEELSLQEMVLGYCRQVGGLVEPPAYGIHEILLPDEVAARWGVEPIQRLVFTPETSDPGVTAITYTHPLVETIVEELRQQTANGMFFINNVRLEKPGLYAAIEKAFVLPNARLFPVHGAIERQRMYHLVRFNFKASLISDEKRELILPVWMNVQGGYAVQPAEIERLAILDLENQSRHLLPAEPTWTTGAALSPGVLNALLERARQSALIALAPNLAGLQKRLQRFLELDRARLTEYYDDLIKDAEKRLRNAEAERHPALEAKLVAIRGERQSKLADVEQKYLLRVELELVNLAVLAQPKLDLLVEIKKRTGSVQRRAVWDPLRHIVEPLCCDVCGQAGDGLHLCEEGHVAHAGCLAPQCVECKRTFCQQCAEKVQTCAVCDRPVCIHSLVKCSQCQRVTCHDHLNECHAVDGAPRRSQAESNPPVVEPPAKAEPVARQKPARQKESPKAKPTLTKPKPAAQPTVTGDYLDVYADPAQGVITAFVMVKKREIAARRWEMTDQGISSECRCEKGDACDRNGVVYRPAPNNQLDEQMMKFINALRTEYGVGVTKVHYYHVRQEQVFDERKLKLPSSWRDEATLAEARQGFDQLAAKNSRSWR